MTKPAAARRLHVAAPPHDRDRRYASSGNSLRARIERLYIASVAFTLGAAGTAVGFVFGIVPYFRPSIDMSQYDWFFVSCVAFGSLVGLCCGLAIAPRWYRDSEGSPHGQRRMLAYLPRRAMQSSGTSARTLKLSQRP
jgi:hypothetical protein